MGTCLSVRSRVVADGRTGGAELPRVAGGCMQAKKQSAEVRAPRRRPLTLKVARVAKVLRGASTSPHPVIGKARFVTSRRGPKGGRKSKHEDTKARRHEGFVRLRAATTNPSSGHDTRASWTRPWAPRREKAPERQGAKTPSLGERDAPTQNLRAFAPLRLRDLSLFPTPPVVDRSPYTSHRTNGISPSRARVDFRPAPSFQRRCKTTRGDRSVDATRRTTWPRASRSKRQPASSVAKRSRATGTSGSRSAAPATGPSTR